MQRFSGKVALVTGATYGIGFAIAKRLATEGAKVMICSRMEENVKAALDELKKLNLDVNGVVCHVGNSSDRARLIDETIKMFGKLDIFVSNVAVHPHVAIVDGFACPESAWEKIFDTNVKAAYILAKEAYPHLQKQAPGSNIVFVSSIVGLDPHPQGAAYCSSKAAILAMTKSVGKALAKEGIRVNCVAPGIIDTPFLGKDKHLFKDYFIPITPMGRFGEPDEIASAVAFLASDDASYMTCETIVVAGGMTSRL